MDIDTFDAEGLRLLKAFYKVGDREAREAIITLTEAAGQGARITSKAIDAGKPKFSVNLVWSRPQDA